MPATTVAAKLKVPFYGHGRQYHSIKKEIDDAFHAVMESEAYVMGPALGRFEKELAQYFGMKHAVGLNSGTDALWLAFFALGIQPGDEVITTTNTFFATAEAIWIAGGKAVFVDSDPVTNNIDVTKIEAAITLADGWNRSRASVRALRGHEDGQRDCEEAQAVGGGR